ncbi:MAG: anion permease [Candidatus Nealsonbacteria bacterium]|nr:anion permease [Candidatus Nealsonbacteria bacterium]
MAGALVLFAVPLDFKRGVFALDWQSARKLPWGVLLLFGGGLSLASAVDQSGLDQWIGSLIEGLGGLPVVAVMATVVVIVLWMVTGGAGVLGIRL